MHSNARIHAHVSASRNVPQNLARPRSLSFVACCFHRNRENDIALALPRPHPPRADVHRRPPIGAKATNNKYLTSFISSLSHSNLFTGASGATLSLQPGGAWPWRMATTGFGTVAIFSLRFVTNICPTGLRNRLRLRYNFSFSDPTASARFIWLIGERTLTRDRPQL